MLRIYIKGYSVAFLMQIFSELRLECVSHVLVTLIL